MSVNGLSGWQRLLIQRRNYVEIYRFEEPLAGVAIPLPLFPLIYSPREIFRPNFLSKD